MPNVVRTADHVETHQAREKEGRSTGCPDEIRPRDGGAIGQADQTLILTDYIS